MRDASAAAVVPAAFRTAASGRDGCGLLKAKEALLNAICAEKYLNFDADCCGVQRSGFGNKVAYSSWGDYFLMEALARELHQFEPWW